MKCLYCGKETDAYLCPDCRTDEILGKIYGQIMDFFPAREDILPEVRSFVEQFADPKEARGIIPEIFALFDPEIAEYYRCGYGRRRAAGKGG